MQIVWSNSFILCASSSGENLFTRAIKISFRDILDESWLEHITRPTNAFFRLRIEDTLEFSAFLACYKREVVATMSIA